eukprot:CFRG2643T1
MAKRKRKFVQTGEMREKKSGTVSTSLTSKKSDIALSKLRGLADLPNNPFDLRVNRKKHDVIGKKTKGEVGNRLKARSSAITKRRATLLPSLQTDHKANAFVDRRFGETDETLTAEEKMLKRFSIERQKRREKSAIYNLGDDSGISVGGRLGAGTMSEDEEEEMLLTHGGRSLAEIDDFDDRDLRLSDGDDEVDADTRQTTEMHFGGFERGPLESERKGDKPLTRKEIMMEVVKKSKLYKMERQNERAENLEKMDELDEYFGEIMAEGKLQLHNDATREAEKKVNRADKDDYDVSVRALAYELKAKATDRLKTDEELAQEAIEELKTLEAHRLRRMKGENVTSDNKTIAKHSTQSAAAAALALTSVEELDGNLMYARDDNEVYYENGVMMYKGKPVDMSKGLPSPYGGEGVTSSESESESDDENEGDENEGDENEGDAGEGDSESEMDTDLESDVDDNDESDEDTLAMTARPKKKTPLTSKQRKIIAASAAKELPYTFVMPADVEAFAELLNDHTTAEILTIISRLRSCYHVSLKPENREKLGEMYGFVLQYSLAVAGGDADPATDEDAKHEDMDMEVQVVKLLDGLSLILYEMAASTPGAACEAFRSQLMQSTDYLFMVAKKGKSATKNGQRVLVAPVLYLLRMVTLVFPVSDLQHPVTTPAAMLMAQMLTSVGVRNLPDLCSQVFCTSLLGQFVMDSKRFVPAAVNFLTGFIGSFAKANDWANNVSQISSGTASMDQCEVVPSKKKSSKKSKKIAEPIPVQGPPRPCAACVNDIFAVLPPTMGKVPALLKLENITGCAEIKIKKLAFRDLLEPGDDDGSSNTDEMKLNSLSVVVDLIDTFADLYSKYKCFDSIFQPTLHHLQHLLYNSQIFPADLKVRVEAVNTKLTKMTASCVLDRAHQMLQKRKPVALRQFNPKFEERYMHGMSFDPDKDRRERQKLKYLHKQELKGAKRELKQDAAFIARQKLKDRMEADDDRNKKVKRLYGILADSQAERNSLKRMKK